MGVFAGHIRPHTQSCVAPPNPRDRTAPAPSIHPIRTYPSPIPLNIHPMCNVQPARLPSPHAAAVRHRQAGRQAKHHPSISESRFPLPFLPTPSPQGSVVQSSLPLLHLGGNRRVELGEALAQARLRRHGLGHAPADAARLAARERLGGEVVDAGVEAVVDQVAEDVHEVLDLALLQAGFELARLGCCEAGLGGRRGGLVLFFFEDVGLRDGMWEGHTLRPWCWFWLVGWR